MTGYCYEDADGRMVCPDCGERYRTEEVLPRLTRTWIPVGEAYREHIRLRIVCGCVKP